MRWERKLPYRGVSPLFLALSAPGARLPGGVAVVCAWGTPPVPLLRASGARCWLGISPSPSPPLRPLALCAGCRSEGILVSVLPWGPHTPYTLLRAPSGSGGPPHGGFPCWSSRGSPPLALAARHGRALLGGGAPSPFPPSLAAHVKRSQTFGGEPLRHRLVGCVLHRAFAPQGLVPLLPTAVLCRSTAPASLSLSLLPARPEPRL